MSLYCLVINNVVQGDITGLPGSYKNISNFYYLPESQVKDLSWAGYSGEGFWPATVESKPDYTIEQSVERTFTPNSANKTVLVSYKIINLTPTEYQNRISSLTTQVKVIRDSYLKITDFTQLPDAPISQEAKSNYANFRQQLRDLLNGVTDPTTITWPTIPTSAPNIDIPPFPAVPSYK
jgi:hypothetical protein